MKQTGEKVLFWSSLTTMAALSILMMAWSIFPMGGETLPHHVEQVFHIAFRSSALFVALLCGVLATGTIGLTLLMPDTMETAEEIARGNNPAAEHRSEPYN